MKDIENSCKIALVQAEPVWDKESIIYAELDMSLPAACKMEHDVVGHYARPDILELKINDKSRGVHE